MSGYGKVWHLGTREVRDILNAPVYVEEKIDGSQFSFGCAQSGSFWFASRSCALSPDCEDNLFAQAVRTALDICETGAVEPGMTVRGEAMRGPRHNKLRYGRAPRGGLILFDVEGYSDTVSLTREALETFASDVGLECVALLGSGVMSAAEVGALAVGDSGLGGCQREGVVIKQACGGPDRLKAKVVSKAFREKQGVKPKGVGGVGDVVLQYRTEARWDKAIQHLREAGQLQGSPKDIGPVMRELARDLREECEVEIREHLWPKIWKEIVRGVSAGAAEHYLARLAESDDA